MNDEKEFHKCDDRKEKKKKKRKGREIAVLVYKRGGKKTKYRNNFEITNWPQLCFLSLFFVFAANSRIAMLAS